MHILNSTNMADHNNNNNGNNNTLTINHHNHIDDLGFGLELDPADGNQYINELKNKLFEILKPCQTIEQVEERIKELYPQSKIFESYLLDKAKNKKTHHRDRHHSSSSFAFMTSIATKVFNLVRDNFAANRPDNEIIAFVDFVIRDLLKLASEFVIRQKSTSFIVTRNDIRTAMHVDKDLMDMFLSDDESLLVMANHPVLARFLDAQKSARRSNTNSYKEKVKKMVDSENTFRFNLKIIVIVKNQLEKQLPNMKKDIETIFCNIENLLELSTELLNIFEDGLESASQEDEISSMGISKLQSELQGLAEACEFDNYFTFASGRLSIEWREAYDRIVSVIQSQIEDQELNLAVKHLLPNYLLNSIIQFFEYYFSIKQLYELSKQDENYKNHLNSTLSILLHTKLSIENLLESNKDKLKQEVEPLDCKQVDDIRKELEKKLENDKKLPLPDLSPYLFSQPDSEQNIIFEANSQNTQTPVIRCATLIKLVERLTYHEYRPNIVDSFLMTYRSFTNPEELLNLLIQRYDVPDPKLERVYPNLIPSDIDEYHQVAFKHYLRRFRQEYSKPVKMRVINVIKSWVKNHYYDFENDKELLEKLNSFLENVKRTDVIFKSQIESIKNEQEKNSQKEPTKIELLIKEIDFTRIENFDLLSLEPADFAEQLTLIEFDLFKAIKPYELINVRDFGSDNRKDDDRRNISKMTRHFDLLSFWIRKRILEAEDFHRRCDLYEKSIKIMKELRDLNNFTGLLSIGSAIFSAPVIRLTARKEVLPINKTINTILQEYQQLTDNRHQKLQEQLGLCNPPCIPYVGSFQTKLIHAKEGNQTFNERIDTTSPTLKYLMSPATPISPTTPLPTSRTTPTSTDHFSFAQPHEKMINYTKQTMRAKLVAQIGLYQNQGYNFEIQENIIKQIKCIEYQMEEFAKGLPKYKDGKTDMMELTNRLDTYLDSQSKKILPKS